MSRSALATVAAVLALGTSAFAALPERARPLAHGPEPHFAAHHSSLHHAALSHVPRTATHTRAAAARSSHAHAASAALREHAQHAVHPRRLEVLQEHTRGRGAQRKLPTLQARLHHQPRTARTAEPNPVVAVFRPANALRPQLPPVSEAALEPVALPRLYNERGRLIMPAALVGSHEILLHQNLMADQDGLGRIQDDADLDAMRERGLLVALPAGPALAVDPRLPLNRRCARPWTTRFVSDLSRDYFARFHAPLQLTSAVRTVAFQQRLIHHNGNAAPAEGDTASPHLTGQAIDLGKRGMTSVEVAWMRGYLLPLIQSGKIDVEEEFKQSCFHISVYRTYGPPLVDHYSVASRGTTGTLATMLP